MSKSTLSPFPLYALFWAIHRIPITAVVCTSSSTWLHNLHKRHPYPPFKNESLVKKNLVEYTIWVLNKYEVTNLLFHDETRLRRDDEEFKGDTPSKLTTNIFRSTEFFEVFRQCLLAVQCIVVINCFYSETNNISMSGLILENYVIRKLIY